MFLVAIAELHGGVDTNLGSLAAELGTTLYELRLLLNAGLPAVVVASVDAAKARAAEAALGRHGHSVVACDRADIVPTRAMTALTDFAFTPHGLLPGGGATRELPFDDVGALLRATQRTTTETVEEVSERKFRPGMAIATGGLVLSKKKTREVAVRTEQREQVLYLFRRSGEPAWILRERGARYGGLGGALRPTALENFQTTIARLRQSAPRAAYDERLMNGRPVRGVADGGDATDILAHLLATYLMGRPL
jgi:hypothetical protein